MTKQNEEKANIVLKEHGILMTNFISMADHSAVLIAMNNYRMQGSIDFKKWCDENEHNECFMEERNITIDELYDKYINEKR